MQLGIGNNALVFSKTALDKLPAEYRKLFAEARPGFYTATKEAYRKADERDVPIFDKTLERVTCTPEMLKPFEEKAGRPVWEKWVADNKANGLPAQAALDLFLKTAKATQ
jgi:TRAP-type C4-dicarboxylate transport system substrate-binding protein